MIKYYNFNDGTGAIRAINLSHILYAQRVNDASTELHMTNGEVISINVVFETVFEIINKNG